MTVRSVPLTYSRNQPNPSTTNFTKAMGMDNVIPINRGLVRTLQAILQELGKLAWEGPKEFNAILVDRKNFVQSIKVPNPPPMTWQIPLRPSIFKSMAIYRTDDHLMDAALYMHNERVEFRFYRKIGDILEYREL